MDLLLLFQLSHSFVQPRATVGKCNVLTIILFLQSMFVAEWTPEQGWQGQMKPYGPLNLDPAAQAGFR